MSHHDLVINGKYRHFKNKKRYQVLGVARHSETLEEMVVYRALYHSDEFGDQQIWVRPAEMFCETLMHDGQMVERFQLIDDE